MRIISNFKDYYDSAQGYGIDPKLVYIRKQEDFCLEARELWSWSTGYGERKSEYNEKAKIFSYLNAEQILHCDSLGAGIIAFCGKLYPFWYNEEATFYNIDEIVKYLKGRMGKFTFYHHDKYIIESLLSNEKRTGIFRRLNRYTWKKLQEEYNFSVPDSFHLYFKSPIVAVEQRRILVNPRLKDYGFARIVDPYTAFQEISMFLGNNMATQMDPEVHISDKIRAESKGFDDWSFRRHKEESKKNKKR